MSAARNKHWRLAYDAENIGWLTLDQPDRSTNVLSPGVFHELDALLDELAGENLDGLVITSAKENGFIAGADVHAFSRIQSRFEALEIIQLGQGVFNKLAALPFPSLCLINGFCLGGRRKLALACDYRIALDDPDTRLALPEVKLGIHPGWGGTLRLPRLTGTLAAMDLMLSGRALNARAALKAGLVDRVVPARQLHRAAKILLQKRPARQKPPAWHRLLEPAPCRRLLAKYLRRKVSEHARPEHYPAPHALIDLWQQQPATDTDHLAAEAESVAGLIMTPAAQNLVRAFILREQLKAQGDSTDFTPRHVHVVGAGVMGGDIAAWCVLSGLRVSLQDREPRLIAPAVKRACKLFHKQLKHPRRVQAAMDRLLPDLEGNGIAQADVVIEAIVEDREIKQALLQDIEPQLKPGALLATNTSSITLGHLSGALKQPGRLAGIHFFNPVAKMQLVEVVHDEATDPLTLKQATAFCRHIRRLPLPVKSSAGFLVNRILMPYLIEAVTLLEEGTPAAVIDEATRSFGMPMGPVQLADSVGLDICLSVANILAKSLDMNIPDELQRQVDQGHLGRKSGRGFYKYRKGKAQIPKVNMNEYDTAEISERMILLMLNESVACLREELVANADLLDAGMIFGAGFAPFRGGPVHYIETCGKQAVAERMQRLQEKFGERFRPDPGME